MEIPQREMVEFIVSQIKKRFPNLTVEETIKIAHDIGYGILDIIIKANHGNANRNE